MTKDASFFVCLTNGSRNDSIAAHWLRVFPFAKVTVVISVIFGSWASDPIELSGVEFLSGTHTVNTRVDGVNVGGDAMLTIFEPAHVDTIPGHSSRASLDVGDAAYVRIEGGRFLGRVKVDGMASLDASFESVDVGVNATAAIYGGTFSSQVIARTDGQLFIWGGDFQHTVGFDSNDNARLTIFGKEFWVGPLDDDPPVLSSPGDSLVIAATMHPMPFRPRLSGKYVDGNEFSFLMNLDGSGGEIHLLVVPESTSACLAIFGVAALTAIGRAASRRQPH